MPTLVIGGHTRNIGKTSVVARVIAELPHLRWTAIKITQFGHGVCSANGEPCECETADHPLAVSEEFDHASGTDTSRFLAAGAVRSLWIRTRQGDLASAMPALRRELARSENAILESNSVLRFLQPDLYAAVLDPQVADFKMSAMRYLDRADAILLARNLSIQNAWSAVAPSLMRHAPVFQVPPPEFHCPAFITMVERMIQSKGKKSSGIA